MNKYCPHFRHASNSLKRFNFSLWAFPKGSDERICDTAFEFLQIRKLDNLVNLIDTHFPSIAGELMA